MLCVRQLIARISTLLLLTVLTVCINYHGRGRTVTAFSPAASIQRKHAPVSVSGRTPSLLASERDNENHHYRNSNIMNEEDDRGIIVHEKITAAIISRALYAATLSLAIFSSPLFFIIGTTSPANADEWGKETEAPTLFTGENVMICKKRGPLGACLETTLRTSENDNDKALSYFKDPAPALKLRRQQDLDSLNQESQGNELIQKLRQQSLENKEKNDLVVLQKTLMNDRGASFGPFDRQVVILNTDGVTFTLLQNPQAMRLKDAGYIDDDRKFIIQPSKEIIEDALVAKEGNIEGLGGAIKGLFGGSGSGVTSVIKNEDGSANNIMVAPSSSSSDRIDGDESDFGLQK